jgi:hypothetical protein
MLNAVFLEYFKLMEWYQSERDAGLKWLVPDYQITSGFETSVTKRVFR